MSMAVCKSRLKFPCVCLSTTDDISMNENFISESEQITMVKKNMRMLLSSLANVENHDA